MNTLIALVLVSGLSWSDAARPSGNQAVRPKPSEPDLKADNGGGFRAEFPTLKKFKVTTEPPYPDPDDGIKPYVNPGGGGGTNPTPDPVVPPVPPPVPTPQLVGVGRLPINDPKPLTIEPTWKPDRNGIYWVNNGIQLYGDLDKEVVKPYGKPYNP